MLDQPQIVETDQQFTAVIRLTIPRDEIQQVMAPGIAELLDTPAAQGSAPAGPVFSHHFNMDQAEFDFEIGVPLQAPLATSGRVKSSQLPASTVVRTVYHGPYEGLGAARGEFRNWVAADGLKPAPDLWERYLSGPAENPDPATWCTELNLPLLPEAVRKPA